MANKKGLFGILNDGSGAGEGVFKAVPNTTLGSAVDCTIAAPTFINDSGVLVFPQLNADGTLPVSLEAAGICYDGYAQVTGSTSFQDLGTITASLAKTYDRIGISVSSMTEACYKLCYIDDAAGVPVETILAEFYTGPGQYSYCCHLDCVDVDTTSGTGVQEIKLKGKLLDATGAEITGTVWAKELSA